MISVPTVERHDHRRRQGDASGALVLNSLWYWLLFRRQRPRFIDHVVLSLQLACFSALWRA